MKSFLKKWSLNLCKLSGEDVAIIDQCNRKIRIKFTWIGSFVLVILICCFLSAMFFVDNMFHSVFLDITIGLVWSSIVTNMYVLLLYTITPTLLPVRDRRKEKGKIASYQTFNFSFSMILRILMMVLLAIITAQPLNVLILGEPSMLFVENIRFLLETNLYSLWISTAVILIFIIPIFLKYRIRKLAEFYQKKATINKRLIKDNYLEFKNDYKTILDNKIQSYNRHLEDNLKPYITQLITLSGDSEATVLKDISAELSYVPISKYEYWADPPYRTQRHMAEGKNKTEGELLNLIYSKTN